MSRVQTKRRKRDLRMRTETGESRTSKRNRSKTNAPAQKQELFKRMRDEYAQAFELIDSLAKAVKELPHRHPDNPPRLYITGQCIPDYYKGLAVDSFDCTVYGVAPTELETILTKHNTSLTRNGSASFIKVSDKLCLAVTTARDRSSQVSSEAEIYSLTPKDHLRMVDFTVESLAIDPLTYRWIDLYRGFSHLQHGILDVTQAKFEFSDDSDAIDNRALLLPYRAAQIASTYNLEAAPRLVKALSTIVARSSTLQADPQEAWETFKKLLLEGTYPEQGFLLMHKIQLLEKLFPSVQALEPNKRRQVLGEAIFALCKIQEAVPGRTLLASEHTAALLTAFLMPIANDHPDSFPSSNCDDFNWQSSERTDSLLEGITKNIRIPETVISTIRDCLTTSPEAAGSSKSVSNLISEALLAA